MKHEYSQYRSKYNKNYKSTTYRRKSDAHAPGLSIYVETNDEKRTWLSIATMNASIHLTGSEARALYNTLKKHYESK